MRSSLAFQGVDGTQLQAAVWESAWATTDGSSGWVEPGGHGECGIHGVGEEPHVFACRSDRQHVCTTLVGCVDNSMMPGG